MEWMPIESAPIKAFEPENWFMANSPRVLIYPGPHIAYYGYTKKGGGRWRSYRGNEIATHWMPLPPPPEMPTKDE